jgi:hypothetical protein
MSDDSPRAGMDDYLLPDTGSDKMRTGMVVILIINLGVCFGLIAVIGALPVRPLGVDEAGGPAGSG